MRALRWVVTCTVLLAAGAAYGAEPVKIRASWIVAPSDWTPLLLEKPDLMKNNGKILRLRAAALPGHTCGHHRAGEQRDRARQPRLLLARARDPERQASKICASSATSSRTAPTATTATSSSCSKTARCRRSRICKGKIVADQCGRQRRRHRHACDAAQARTRGQARLHPGRGAVSHHEGHAGAEKADLASFVAPFSFDPELKQIAQAAVQPAVTRSAPRR